MRHLFVVRLDSCIWGDAENAGMENAALENAGKTKYGKRWMAKGTEPKQLPGQDCVARFVSNSI